MKSVILNETLVVAINHLETCRLASGERLENRLNPLCLDAKIGIRPLGELDFEYQRSEKFGDDTFIANRGRYASRVLLFDNSDIEIYVPWEVAVDAGVAAETIARGKFEAHNVANLEEIASVMPANGLQIRFDDGILLHGFAEAFAV